MFTMFLRDGDEVYRTYNTTRRGVDRLLFSNDIKDFSVYGRQEDWEDSPPGWPQPPDVRLGPRVIHDPRWCIHASRECTASEPDRQLIV